MVCMPDVMDTGDIRYNNFITNFWLIKINPASDKYLEVSAGMSIVTQQPVTEQRPKIGSGSWSTGLFSLADNVPIWRPALCKWIRPLSGFHVAGLKKVALSLLGASV
ncbi:hypothetical protein scyTo_0018594, partial [Scyliorhinus torazame]|nr:hypothetical protein [Scyliorhinus torazame]